MKGSARDSHRNGYSVFRYFVGGKSSNSDQREGHDSLVCEEGTGDVQGGSRDVRRGTVSLGGNKELGVPERIGVVPHLVGSRDVRDTGGWSEVRRGAAERSGLPVGGTLWPPTPPGSREVESGGRGGPCWWWCPGGSRVCSGGTLGVPPLWMTGRCRRGLEWSDTTRSNCVRVG